MLSHTAGSGGQIRGVERGQLADRTEAYTGIVWHANLVEITVRYHDMITCNKTTVCLLGPKYVLSLTQGGCSDTADRPLR